ncbi:MAG: methyltransferase [Spirochaetales bacterium]|nr:methyltransferase [Spirochaetales bacterium]
MTDFDSYVNKTVPFKFRGQDMSFDLSHALFSSFDVDAGSRLLLKLVAQNVDETAIGSILDVGSGVGVLGVACARGYPGATLRMRDRDAIACAFSERNARRNKVKPSSVDHALFIDGIEAERFDLVLCNVPAKAGPPVLDRFLRVLPGIVSERGYGAVVVVAPIAAASMASIQASGATIVATELRAGHSAVLFRRGDAREVEPGQGALWSVLERTEQSLRAGKLLYKLRGYWGLPEFDTPGYDTELTIDALERAMAGTLTRRAAVINPGVGRVACHLRARAKNAEMDLCGRDALALAASERNLSLGASVAATNACAFPSMLPDASYDLVVEHPDLVPRVDTIDGSWRNAARILKLGGSFVAAMPSTAMERFERRQYRGFVRIAARKKKGFACAVWRLESSAQGADAPED